MLLQEGFGAKEYFTGDLWLYLVYSMPEKVRVLS